MNLNKTLVDTFNSYCVVYDNINILSLSQVYVFELSQRRMDNSLLGLIKKLSLENYVKYIFFFFIKEQNIAKTKYLFINDIFNASMISNMRSVQNQFDVPFKEIITDKRLLSDYSKFIYKYLSVLSYLAALPKYLKVLINSRKTIIALANEFKISPTLLSLNLLDTLFVLCTVKGLLKKENHTKNIILNTDVHKISRAIVLQARTNNIRTFVIQHGSTVLEYGYLPVSSDYMLAWGELSSNWFLERDTPLEKLKVLGTPKMDFLQNFTINKEPHHDEVKNILIIVNPIGDENVNIFLRTILDSDIHKTFQLTIKLHPSSFDNRDLVEKHFGNTKAIILKNENTQNLIYETDVVITSTSTVGNEAIAFFKPLIQISIKNFNITMDYEIYNCCHKISTSEKLKKLIGDKGKIYSKLTNYNNFIENYFYRLDGLASKRIMDFIISKE
ncbi:hypothetical protein [uncultured Croceitalea sp.]|uniref:hypothetical protein n=1 Tax=uncultured Croceitalea sp. TaxID=1798908 RepID=UPI003305D50E